MKDIIFILKHPLLKITVLGRKVTLWKEKRVTKMNIWYLKLSRQCVCVHVCECVHEEWLRVKTMRCSGKGIEFRSIQSEFCQQCDLSHSLTTLDFMFITWKIIKINDQS